MMGKPMIGGAQALCLLAALFMLGGCSSQSWSSINPITWWHNLEGGAIAQQRPPPPGADQPDPNLASVPAKPEEPDRAALQNISDALIADRTNAQHMAAAAPLADPSSPSSAPGLFGVGSTPPPGPPPPVPPAGQPPNQPPNQSVGASATLPTANSPPPPPSGPPTPPAKAPVGAVQSAPLAAPTPPSTGAPPGAPTTEANLPPLPAAPPAPANVPGVAAVRNPSLPPPPTPPASQPTPAPASPSSTTAAAAPPPAPGAPAAPPVPTPPSTAAAAPPPATAPATPPPAAATAPSPAPTAPAPTVIASTTPATEPVSSGNTVGVVFANGSSDLSPSATAPLRGLAGRRGNGLIAVTGYGDAADPSPDIQAAALKLGLARAQSIANALVAAGVPATAVQIDAQAMGRGGTARLVQ